MKIKNVEFDQCLFIGFEGMDASYKETNSKQLYDYLKNNYFKEYIDNKKLDIYYFSFPNYKNPSSYFVREYLNGKYDEKETNLHTVTYFYMMDMYDTLSKITIDKPTIIIFDRYYISQLYYLTKFAHKTLKKYDDNFKKRIILKVEECAEHLILPKLNFLYKMYTDLETMENTIKKRCEEKGKSLDVYESDIEYLKSVREIFMSDNFINKDRLLNITGNNDILYNISVTNKDRDRVWDDVKVAIYNTLNNYKKIIDKYYNMKVEKDNV